MFQLRILSRTWIYGLGFHYLPSQDAINAGVIQGHLWDVAPWLGSMNLMMTHSRINSWWNLSMLKTDFGRNKDHGEEIEMMIILPAKCIITHNTYTPGSCTALATAVPAALWTRCLDGVYLCTSNFPPPTLSSSLLRCCSSMIFVSEPSIITLLSIIKCYINRCHDDKKYRYVYAMEI